RNGVEGRVRVRPQVYVPLVPDAGERRDHARLRANRKDLAAPRIFVAGRWPGDVHERHRRGRGTQGAVARELQAGARRALPHSRHHAGSRLRRVRENGVKPLRDTATLFNLMRSQELGGRKECLALLRSGAVEWAHEPEDETIEPADFAWTTERDGG